MKRPLIHLLVVVTGLVSAGCAQTPKQAAKVPAPEGLSELQGRKPEVLQRELMNFADRFASSTAAAYDELAGVVTNPEAKRIAIERKASHVASAYINATDANPIVGLLDMLVMTRLLRETAQDPWFSDIFGDNALKLVIKLRVQEEDIWALAARYLTQAQLKELSDAIQSWRDAHPAERYVSMVRLSEFPAAKSPAAASAKAPNSVFGLLFLDPFASLDPAMREVESSREAADRYFFYLQRMPMLLSWRVDSMSRQILNSPELQQVVENTSKFTSATSAFADNVKAIGDVMKRYPQQLTEERSRAVEQVAEKTTKERTATVQQASQAVALERDAAIKQIAQAVAAERDQIARITTAGVAKEREALVAEWNGSLNTQRELVIHDVAEATARATYRFFMLECAVVILGVGLVYFAFVILKGRAAGKSENRWRAPAGRY